MDAIDEVPDRGHHDLRREWQRRDHGPGRYGAIVGAVGGAARQTVVKLATDAVNGQGRGPWSVARGVAPAVLAVEGEPAWIPDRVLALDICRAAAVAAAPSLAP